MTEQNAFVAFSKVAVPIAAVVVAVAILGLPFVLSLLVKLAGGVMLATMAFASWIGFRQNRHRNREWPFNIGLLLASSLGLAGLTASLFG